MSTDKGGVCPLDCSPARNRNAPVNATMTPLSVHSLMGGTPRHTNKSKPSGVNTYGARGHKDADTQDVLCRGKHSL
jgi:hypothetical protein